MNVPAKTERYGGRQMRVTGTQYQHNISSFHHDKHKESKVDISDVEEKSIIVEISQEGKRAIELKDRKAFSNEIVALDRSANYLPEYSGVYEVDKTIATAIENCSKEEQAFVYDIIRQNFLINSSNSMTEEERQANISLGMKKAEYASEHFIPENQKESFLNAMESIAKLASAGKSDETGNMDYGVNKKSYLGHGSNLVYTDNPLDIMKKMDTSAYAEYKKIKSDTGNENSALDALKYMTKWYAGAVKKNPNMVDEYYKKSDDYMEENVKKQKLDETFSDIDVTDKNMFFESLRLFHKNNPNFLTNILNRELSSQFWN